MGFFFFAMGAALLGSFFMTDVPLLVNGVRTFAVVEGIEPARRNSGYLAATFKVGEYETVRTRIHVSARADYAVGQKVPIVHLRDDPGSVEVYSFGEMATTWLMKILFGGTALGMALIDFLPSRQREKARA